MIALAPTPVLMTGRLVLRAPQGDDFAAWAAFATSDRSRYIGGPLSRALAWRAWGHVIGHWAMRGFGMFVLAARIAPERPLGMAGPWYPDGWPEREIGWSLWSDADEGKGYAREAAAAARDHAFGALGWTSAVSYIHPDNARSIALAERLGATRDRAAPCPEDRACLVYRHPRPEPRP
jgi:RimJ/RimL family protein N-acetyltransferase